MELIFIEDKERDIKNWQEWLKNKATARNGLNFCRRRK